MRAQVRWRDAPWEYCPYKTLYNRWKHWSDKGIFARIMLVLAAEHDRFLGPADVQSLLPDQELGRDAACFDAVVQKGEGIEDVTGNLTILNGFTALGIPDTQARGQVPQGKGNLRPSDELCDRVHLCPPYPPQEQGITAGDAGGPESDQARQALILRRHG